MADFMSFLPYMMGGLGLADNLLTNNSRGDIQDYMRDQETRRWQEGKAYDEAYRAYMGDYSAASAANSAAAAARSRSAAAAAAQTERNRQGAARKGMRAEVKGLRNAYAGLEPYINAGKEALPGATKAYMSSLGFANDLLGGLKQPTVQAQLNASKPAWSTGVPIPKFMRGSKA